VVLPSLKTLVSFLVKGLIIPVGLASWVAVFALAWVLDSDHMLGRSPKVSEATLARGGASIVTERVERPERDMLSLSGVMGDGFEAPPALDALAPELSKDLKNIATLVKAKGKVLERFQVRLVIGPDDSLPQTQTRSRAILAAEFMRAGERYTVIRYTSLAGTVGYYWPNGRPLEPRFLRSPLAVTRITSPIQIMRFHPILQRMTPHWGIDYGAPIGTPVMALGDGFVRKARWLPGSGLMVELEHVGDKISRYKHLAALAKTAASGVRVRRGQIIGYVGATGLATGPHLHLEFIVDGRPCDPAAYTRSTPDMNRDELARFMDRAAKVVGLLPDWSPATASHAPKESRDPSDWS